ncbi:MAG: hypothetical protein JJT95_11015 [Pararhodobacter sp.]|nr:hypothetical protein [Pararhodobacter sp.]
MSRLPQNPATRGSQKWLQHAVARAPHLLQPPSLPALTWLSPLAGDDFAEYRDGAFLQRLGLGHLAPVLADFWPRGGPVWDGLAMADNIVVLAEAKAHLREALSTPCAATAPASRARITEALAETRRALRGDDRSDWMRVFFQQANRLAHLQWLVSKGVDAHLLFIGFCGDTDMPLPGTPEAWQAMDLAVLHALGLGPTHPLAGRVHHVHPPVVALADAV